MLTTSYSSFSGEVAAGWQPEAEGWQRGWQPRRTGGKRMVVEPDRLPGRWAVSAARVAGWQPGWLAEGGSRRGGMAAGVVGGRERLPPGAEASAAAGRAGVAPGNGGAWVCQPRRV